jgi:hypothetical protein
MSRWVVVAGSSSNLHPLEQLFCTFDVRTAHRPGKAATVWSQCHTTPRLESAAPLQTQVGVLRMQSSLLKSVPDWVGELKCLTTLDNNQWAIRPLWC